MVFASDFHDEYIDDDDIWLIEKFDVCWGSSSSATAEEAEEEAAEKWN